MANGITLMGSVRSLLLGSGVIIVTPLLATVIPALADLGVISLGTAVSAGIAAFGVDWVLGQFPALNK